jgi:hypothetical protein
MMGIGIGAAVGVTLDNIAVGIGVGVAVGLLFSGLLKRIIKPKC